MKILLVDDRPENLIALEDMLEQEGRTFLTAASGDEALRMLLDHQDIGLILLDVQMPGIDGFELARMLKTNSKTRDIPIIFVTAISKEDRFVLRGFDEGAVDYLQKPLDIHITRAKVKVFEQLYLSQQQLKCALDNEAFIRKQLERFVYTVSHDLKSPLSGIVMQINTARYMSRAKGESGVSEESLQTIEKACMHLIHMVDSILEYSRKSYDEQKLEDVDVEELVRDIFRLLFPSDRISFRIATPLPVLRTNKLKLQQVFQNLISNAIKYNDKPEGEIEVGCRAASPYYVFSVKDNGPGIEEADTEKVFRLFHKGKEGASGDSSTGVGLNVMKIIVEEQGGRLWVDSEPGKGSTFYFEWKQAGLEGR